MNGTVIRFLGSGPCDTLVFACCVTSQSGRADPRDHQHFNDNKSLFQTDRWEYACRCALLLQMSDSSLSQTELKDGLEARGSHIPSCTPKRSSHRFSTFKCLMLRNVPQ